MVISRTPFRMSFFGGGTDFVEFYKEYGGCVLSSTFDKYCYVTVRHLPCFFDYRSEICYSEIERVRHVDDIRHPLVREGMKMLDIHELRLTYEADLPARSGLGTSSAFAVGMLNAFHFLKGQHLSKRKLADEAIYLERELCREAGGQQDQIAVSYGGMNKIVFDANGYEVRPIMIHPTRKKKLNDHLMLFFTGFSRLSFEIQIQTKAELKNKIHELQSMRTLADEAEEILMDRERDLNDFGRLLDDNWQLKRGLNPEISTAAVDEMYEKAKAAGALGGKLLGAGGGGFILFYVELDKQAAVRHALKELLYVPFRFEDEGSRIIYAAPEPNQPVGDGQYASDEPWHDDLQGRESIRLNS